MNWKKLFSFSVVVSLVVTLLVVVGAFASTYAQSTHNNVTVAAGVVQPSSGDYTASGFVELQKTLGTRKLLLDNTLSLTDNLESNTGQEIRNSTLLRGYIGKNFFAAGGMSFGSRINTGMNEDMFLNPTMQAGVTVDVGQRFQFEPYVQLDTPDVLSANPVRSLTANLTTKFALNEKVGLSFDTGISQIRNDNRFLQSGGQNVPFAFGGVYFIF